MMKIRSVIYNSHCWECWGQVWWFFVIVLLHWWLLL